MQARIPEPWLSFLTEVDQVLSESVEVHCLGGFALTVLAGRPLVTADVDFIEIRPKSANEELIRIAGQDSQIARKHHLNFQRVSVADYPEDYEGRLIDITPKGFSKLRLMALEAHDIVLSKITRNSAKDRADVDYLDKNELLNWDLLKERFEKELRPNLLRDDHAVLTMKLWIEEFGARQGRKGKKSHGPL